MAGKDALHGIRVCFIGNVWAGPLCAATLADMGAEVIKVESRSKLDMFRWVNTPDGSIERGGYFIALDRNLLGVTINMELPEGRELAKKIIERSDVLLENMSPKVLRKWGLDYDNVQRIKPDIVMASLSGFGQTGPWALCPAYGPHLSALSGFMALIGYENEAPMGEFMAYNDPLSGIAGAFAVMAALRYRARTGRGQYIDLSEWEAGVTMMGQEILDYTMNGRVASCMGNSSSWMAPHGCYRCKGENRWITIVCQTEGEWQSLCKATGNSQWLDDERFVDNYTRVKNRKELDRLVEGWTSGRTDYEIMEILQHAGVAAAPVLTLADVFTDPHAQEEGYVLQLPHPEEPGAYVCNVAWKFSETPGMVRRHAPLLGEHNEYVLCELCGLPKEELQKLMEEKVVW